MKFSTELVTDCPLPFDTVTDQEMPMLVVDEVLPKLELVMSALRTDWYSHIEAVVPEPADSEELLMTSLVWPVM